MKYQILETIVDIELSKIVNILLDENHGINFPAVIGNPNYDQFLVDTKLTDKKVKALTPDKWYDFPKES
jgi:hypothetical protein